MKGDQLSQFLRKLHILDFAGNLFFKTLGLFVFSLAK